MREPLTSKKQQQIKVDLPELNHFLEKCFG